MLGVGVRSCLLLSPTVSWHGDKGSVGKPLPTDPRRDHYTSSDLISFSRLTESLGGFSRFQYSQDTEGG